MLNKKDFWRPIFGTIMLQPLMMLWAYFTNTPYLSNLGPLTVITTLYLMPVYGWYETICNSPKLDEPKWI